jgi:hypothetical protein
VGGQRVDGTVDETAFEAEAAAAFPMRFHLPQAAREAWRAGAEVRAGVEHPALSVIADLDDAQRRAVAEDL